MTLNKPWIGIDLDGTLAVYDSWRGIEHIGQPVPAVRKYVYSLLNAGIDVRIFTARVQKGRKAVNIVKKWCLRHLDRTLPVTDKKDFDMVAMLDDRATVVEKNTGRFITMPPTIDEILWHHSPNNPENPEALVDVKN